MSGGLCPHFPLAYETSGLETIMKDLGLLDPWFEQHHRITWIPIVRNGDGTLLDSKFGGIPLTTEASSWPACPRCHKKMTFFFQLNLSTLPAKCPLTPSNDLIQLFYCTNEEDEQSCEFVFVSDFPFSPCAVVRRIAIDSAQSESSFNDRQVMDRVRTITGWRALKDYPSPPEHDELGLLWNFSLPEDSLSLECKQLDLIINDVDIEFAEKKLHKCRTGDKLLGWPNWIQGADYPKCPICNRMMSFIFQIASEENLNFMFGSSGTAYIFACDTHKSSFAFNWS